MGSHAGAGDAGGAAAVRPHASHGATALAAPEDGTRAHVLRAGRWPRLCADQPGARAQLCAFRQEGLTLSPPHTPASRALCGLARVQVDEGPHKERPPSPETLQLLASVSPPEIRGQAPHRWERRDLGSGWGAARQPEPGMEGPSGMGGRVRRAGPQGSRGGLARVGRLRAGISSGQLGLFSPLRKAVAVAGSESPGLLTGLVLGRRAGGSEGGGPSPPSASLSRLFAAEGPVGPAWPPCACAATSPGRRCVSCTAASPGRRCVSFALVTSSC